MTVDQVLQAISGHIATLDAGEYKHSDLDQGWHEARSPFSVEDAPEDAHLAYVVTWTDAPVSGMTRNARGNFVQSRTSVEVQFAYRLRSDSQQTDYRMSARAARDIVAAVNDDFTWSGGECDVEVVNAGQPVIAREDPYVVVSCIFVVQHEYGV